MGCASLSAVWDPDEPRVGLELLFANLTDEEDAVLALACTPLKKVDGAPLEFLKAAPRLAILPFVADGMATAVVVGGALPKSGKSVPERELKSWDILFRGSLRVPDVT